MSQISSRVGSRSSGVEFGKISLVAYPSYLNLSEAEWQKRIEAAWKLLNPCRVCPRECGVNRLQRTSPALGFCQTKDKVRVFDYHPHFGEEACLRGNFGSGTIFFSSCNLACVFCFNYQISQLRLGQEISIHKLAQMMLRLQKMGCPNINLVSPTIWVPQILKALYLATNQGLKVPLVYNTGGHDAVNTLRLLNGVVDIYMPDIKYADNRAGLKYSLVPNYWSQVQRAVIEMYRQVGDLIIRDSVAYRGLLIRHLVLPNDIAGTAKVMKFLANQVSPETYVNLMSQYRPDNKAHSYPELARPITKEEYGQALVQTLQAGITRLDKADTKTHPGSNQQQLPIYQVKGGE
jgi:putative pyruvate formate lyase activating enzyme